MKYSLRIDRAVDCFRRAGIEIKEISHSPWIDGVEGRIGGKLPEAYRCLVSRYSFPIIDLGPIELFSNLGDGSVDDITHAPFRDAILSRWLIQHGYFHFARLTSDHYDPVCLDIRRTVSEKAPVPVVRFDHEAILQEQTTVPRILMTDSFLGLVEGDLPNSSAPAPNPPKS